MPVLCAFEAVPKQSPADLANPCQYAKTKKNKKTDTEMAV